MTYLEKMHDVVTGEVTEIPYTDEQIKEAKANEKQAKEFAQKVKAESEAKEAARQAIFDRLGLTADEAKLLLG